MINVVTTPELFAGKRREGTYQWREHESDKRVEGGTD